MQLSTSNPCGRSSSRNRSAILFNRSFRATSFSSRRENHFPKFCSAIKKSRTRASVSDVAPLAMNSAWRAPGFSKFSTTTDCVNGRGVAGCWMLDAG